jgi:hypothetical protein
MLLQTVRDLTQEASFHEEVKNYCESVAQSSSKIWDKMYAQIMVVLASQDTYLPIFKSMIEEAKGNAEQLRDAYACKAQHFRLVKGFVIINNV